jgi:hypothetical protein
MLFWRYVKNDYSCTPLLREYSLDDSLILVDAEDKLFVKPSYTVYVVTFFMSEVLEELD